MGVVLSEDFVNELIGLEREVSNKFSLATYHALRGLRDEELEFVVSNHNEKLKMDSIELEVSNFVEFGG